MFLMVDVAVELTVWGDERTIVLKGVVLVEEGGFWKTPAGEWWVAGMRDNPMCDYILR